MDIIIPNLLIGFFGAMLLVIVCLAFYLIALKIVRLLGFNTDSAKLQRQILEASMFENYKSRFPNLISGNGLKCFQCRGSKTRTAPKKEKPFVQHFCNSCGATLFYSKD